MPSAVPLPLQGLLTIRPGQCPDPRRTLTRLWTHEAMRVFHDRLVSPQDKAYFTHLLHELLRTRFDEREDHDALFVRQSITFGDYLRPGAGSEERVYEEVADPKKLLQVSVKGVVLQVRGVVGAAGEGAGGGL